jgi:hypothetical protein
VKCFEQLQREYAIQMEKSAREAKHEKDNAISVIGKLLCPYFLWLGPGSAYAG